MVYYEQSATNKTLTLLPNRSATWAETRIFIFFICGVMLAIGTFWAFVGAWMILPFSGIEAGLVAFFLYRVCLNTYHRQVITFNEKNITVQFGKHFPKRNWQLNKNSTFLLLEEPKHHLAAVGLTISDGTQTIELGSFLNKSDKQHALEKLKMTGIQVRGFQPKT